MAIKKDRSGLVSIKSLTNDEKKVFIKFLQMERDRHQEDIDNIENTIGKLRSGFLAAKGSTKLRVR